MGYEQIKTEHAGAKNGGGAWMTRSDAKQTAKRRRRQADRRAARLMASGEPMPGFSTDEQGPAASPASAIQA